MSSTGATPIQILIITGSMGAGKTTLMAEASDVLIERDIVHAAIDLDALGIGYISQEADTQAIGRLGLIRFRGHFPEGGYDGHDGRQAIEAHASEFHGGV